MRRELLSALAVVIALAVWPDASRAGNVRLDVFEPDYAACKADCPPPTYEVVFVARPGERNDVTATRDPEGAFVVHDAGARITATRDCTVIDPQTVSCGGSYADDLRVTVRDKRDTVAVLDGPATIEGGSGDDRLTGGPKADILVGGQGNDELHGAAGDDRLADGVKRQRTRTRNDDSFDGGEGTDWIDYAGRLSPVTLDLGRPGAPSGRAGEHDVLGTIENAAGGSASDVLTGDESKNELDGGTGPGADVLDGAGGDDVIWTAPGDRIFGRAGADWIRSSRAYPLLGRTLQRIDCGPDLDVIEEGSNSTLVRDSCEIVDRNGDSIRHHLPLTSLTDPVLTFDQYSDSSTSGIYPEHIELRVSGIAAQRRHPRPGTLLAAADTGDTDPFDVRLSDRGRALLRRYGRIRARVLFGPSAYERSAYMIDLRAPAVGSAAR